MPEKDLRGFLYGRGLGRPRTSCFERVIFPKLGQLKLRGQAGWLLVFKDHILDGGLGERVVEGVVEESVVVQIGDRGDQILREFEGDFFNRRYVVGILHLWKL